jgi:hypothetical protein
MHRNFSRETLRVFKIRISIRSWDRNSVTTLLRKVTSADSLTDYVEAWVAGIGSDDADIVEQDAATSSWSVLSGLKLVAKTAGRAGNAAFMCLLVADSADCSLLTTGTGHVVMRAIATAAFLLEIIYT